MHIIEFNKAQVRAIQHFQGACLVLAGPGSGKTTVITHRTLNLIKEYGVASSNILVVTFTRMAAGEMKERYLSLCGQENCDDAAYVTFGTFHSVFFKMLRHAYRYSPDNIVQSAQQREVILQSIARYGLTVEDENDFAQQLLSEISRVKSERIALDTYYSLNCSEDVFRNIYRDYQQMLTQNRKIDFDDILLYTYELLSQRKDILAAWQNKFQYILVDEFQDINRLQYEIVKMLAGAAGNLFIVGDDDQSIYGFRGAKPELMLNFEKDFPGAVQIKLDINYRSTPQIVSAAREVIDHNKTRYQKNIRTFNQDSEGLDIMQFQDTSEENMCIVDGIRREISQGTVQYSDIAVLTRTNIGGRQLIGKLIEYNIPFVTRDSIPNLYDHWIAKDMLAYIRLACGARDRELFLRVMNKPKRYISRDMLLEEQVDFTLLRERYADKAWMLERIDDLEGDLKVLSRCNPLAAINYIRRAVGYDCYIREYAKEHRISENDLTDILNELLEAAKEQNTYQEWFDAIEQYREELKKQYENSRQEKGKQNAVTVCTMHSAKGLEYREVYMIDANEGITPYAKAVLDEEIEEERRMFYVAMTRAQKKLHIYHVKERYNKKLEVSRFVSEITGRTAHQR